MVEQKVSLTYRIRSLLPRIRRAAMVDVAPFLTTLSVMVADLCKTVLPPEPQPGPQALLSRSEVVPVAIGGQGQGCGSERGFSRSAQHHLRGAFPQVPTREQCTRQMRQQHAAVVAFFLHLGQLLAAQRCASEARDSAGVPPRDATRRGAGWLPGLADIGGSHRLGWYAGCPLLLAGTPVGAIPGLGCGAASTTAQPLAETCCALRCWPQPGLPRGGAPALGPSVVAKGCAGQANHAMGQHTSGAQVLCPPKRKSRTPWPKALRRWLAGMRQSVATVDATLLHPLRLARERPHELSGFQTR
jgi:hypothetical protein